jgi:hypothetical protein
VHPITILELFPSACAEPPAPIVTAPKAVPAQTGSSKLLTPPAPPPPADPPDVDPPPPPPATTRVSIILVPFCVVTALGVSDVLDVTVFFPKEVLLTLPIIPPLVLAI